MSIIKAWRERKAASWQREARYWHQEAVRCSLLAFDIDPLQEPLRWGRLQHRANCARSNERAALAKAAGGTL